jgi:transglutaminase-like putative cysteine protease
VLSSRARLALCAWAATLLAACALLPLVDPATWILQAAFLLGVQTLVGVATRRVPLARPVTVLSQAMVTLLLLTLLFARQQALGGIVPGPEAFARFADLFQQGSDDIARYAIPAPLESDGIRLMLLGGVLLIGLLVDTLAVTFRSAAPAGLPLLALYSVAAGLSDGAGDWVWFLLAAAGYLMLLLAEGRERLSQWGRVFGGAPRMPGAAPAPLAPVRTGRRIGAVALGIALVVPLLPLPAIQGGLLDGAGSGVGSGSGGGGTISAVNPLVSLRDSLNQDQDQVVMTLRTTSPTLTDMYLRIVSLDDFDGTTWRPAKRSITSVPDTLPSPPGLSADILRSEVRTRIRAADGYRQEWLPMPYPPSSVQVGGDWRYEPVGMTLVGDHRQTTGGLTWDVTSLDVQPTAEQLAAAPRPPAVMLREYTEVPDSLPSVVARTARAITAGADSDYARAVKLQDYFAVTGGFQYDTEVEVGSDSGAIARFLRDKQGFCIHFSFAMAAMARTLGIPSRVAVGFAPGTPQADGSVKVGLKDAHAWPELYFEGVGWTRFEPTPSRGTTPSYTVADTPGNTVPDVPRPSHSAGADASTSPTESAGCDALDKRLEACAGALPPVSGDDAGSGTPWWGLLGWSLLGLALAAVPLAPMLWRLRRRAVRLASAQHGPGTSGADGPVPAAGPELAAGPGTAPADGEGIAAGRVLAVWQELTDTAWDFGIPPDEALTPRKAAARIVRLGELDEPAAASVHRVAGAVEQVLFAPRPETRPGLAEDARRVRAALRARASRRTRLRAVVAPRSAVRAVWDLSARWAAIRSRWAARWSALLRRPTPQQPS